MAQPTVHFEIIGRNPENLRRFYGALFGWEFDTSNPVSAAVSEPANYGFTTSTTTANGIPAGVGGGPAYPPQVVVYVGVPDVAAALAKAESLGATRHLAPSPRPDGQLVIAHFTDPEGNLIGLAGPR